MDDSGAITMTSMDVPVLVRKATASRVVEEYFRQTSLQHQSSSEMKADEENNNNNNNSRHHHFEKNKTSSSKHCSAKDGSCATNGYEDSQHDELEVSEEADDDVFAEDASNNNGIATVMSNHNQHHAGATPSSTAKCGRHDKKKRQQTVSLSTTSQQRQRNSTTIVRGRTLRVFSTSSLTTGALAFSSPSSPQPPPPTSSSSTSSDDDEDGGGEENEKNNNNNYDEDEDEDEEGGDSSSSINTRNKKKLQVANKKHQHYYYYHRRHRGTLVANLAAASSLNNFNAIGNVLLRVRRDDRRNNNSNNNSQVLPPIAASLLHHQSGNKATVKLTDQDQFVKAAALGLVDKIIEYLSSSRFIVDIDGQSSSGITALHAAVLRGNIQCAELLIQKGASCEVENNEGDAPLHVAAKGNWHRLVSILLAGGAKINTRNKNMQTPLHIAVHEGCKETVDLLLKRGAVTCFQDKDGNTPLHLAIIKKTDFITSALLEHGDSSVTIVNNNGFNVLHYASKYGYTTGVELVLTHLLRGNHVMRTRGSVSASVSSEATVTAAPSAASPTLPVTLQGQRRWVIDEPKQDGFTALHLAMANGHADIVVMLVKAGAKVNVQTTQTGSTPLHLAIEERLFKAAIAFLQNCPTDSARGFIPDLADTSGCTALHKILAAYSEAHRVRKASLRFARREDDEAYDVATDSTDVSSSNEANGRNGSGSGTGDPSGQRALRDCAFIALWLVQAGSSLSLRNRRGKAPLDYCIDQTFADILQKRGAKHKREGQPSSRHGSAAGLRETPSRLSISGTESPLRTTPEILLAGEPTTPTPSPSGRLPSISAPRKGSASQAPNISLRNNSVTTAELPSPLPPTARTPLTPLPTPSEKRPSRASVSTPGPGPDASGNSRRSSTATTSTITNNDTKQAAVSRLISPSGGGGDNTVSATSPNILQTQQHHAGNNPHQLPKLSISDVLFTFPSSSSPTPSPPGVVRKGSTTGGGSKLETPNRHKRNDSDGSIFAVTSNIVEERDRYQQMLLESREESLCPLCKMRPRRIAFIPCGHFFCQPCGDRLNKCPTCRREVTKSDKLELYK